MEPNKLHQTMSAHPGAAVIDVREEFEFQASRIAGARLLPLPRLKIEAVKEETGGRTDRPVYLVCPNGKRAKLAAGRLEEMGFSNVFYLRGGLAAWRAAGLPLEQTREGPAFGRLTQYVIGGGLLLAGLSNTSGDQKISLLIAVIGAYLIINAALGRSFLKGAFKKRDPMEHLKPPEIR